ncbi:MAG: LysR family transcriptional regulator [Oscillospiraceae bacterium]|nr:LysR family transcriptional regulator [Oscillospiraceae bacterium]
MDLTQLEYFKSVAKWENITKASKELYVSQPTLSQSISRLEDGLGVDLFDRRAGKLHLNDAGRLFLSRVNNAFAELNTGFSELEQYKKNRQAWVYIASSVIDIFKSIILEYHARMPQIHIDHSLTFDRGIMELILNGKVDFVITPDPIGDPSVKCVPLYEEEVFAVVGSAHPLARQKEVTLEELRGCPLVCNNCDSDIKFMETLFQTDYQDLDIIAASNESHIPRELTQRCCCVGFIPARVAVRHLKEPGKGQHPLRISPAFRRTNCISAKCSHQLSPAAGALYRFILEFCARESEEVDAYIRQYYGY